MERDIPRFISPLYLNMSLFYLCRILSSNFVIEQIKSDAKYVNKMKEWQRTFDIVARMMFPIGVVIILGNYAFSAKVSPYRFIFIINIMVTITGTLFLFWVYLIGRICYSEYFEPQILYIFYIILDIWQAIFGVACIILSICFPIYTAYFCCITAGTLLVISIPVIIMNFLSVWKT